MKSSVGRYMSCNATCDAANSRAPYWSQIKWLASTTFWSLISTVLVSPSRSKVLLSQSYLQQNHHCHSRTFLPYCYWHQTLSAIDCWRATIAELYCLLLPLYIVVKLPFLDGIVQKASIIHTCDHTFLNSNTRIRIIPNWYLSVETQQLDETYYPFLFHKSRYLSVYTFSPLNRRDHSVNTN